MKRDAIIALLGAIGADTQSATENKEWVNCRCPLARYTHEQGDTNPSFGIAINEEGHSVWQCFGCSPDAKRVDKLLTAIFACSGEYPYRAAQIYVKSENFVGGSRNFDLSGISFDSWETQNGKKESKLLSVKDKTPIPGKFLREFPLLQNSDSEMAGRCRYFLTQERNLPLWAVYNCGIRIVGNTPVLAFPMTDHDGNIYTIRARRIDSKKIWTLDEEHLGCPVHTIKETGVWFGLHLMDWDKPVVLVESELDCCALVSFGYFNTVASATSSVAHEQLDNLQGSVFYLGHDADKAGRRAKDRIIERMKGKAQLFELDWSLVNRKKDGKPCKDANDLPDKKSARYVFRRAKYIY